MTDFEKIEKYEEISDKLANDPNFRLVVDDNLDYFRYIEKKNKAIKKNWDFKQTTF